MMTFLSYLLVFLLIVDCLLLGLLIMVQLPKKEAGVGMAFGGGAADALFGAGSGNTLTKLTRNCAIAFFILVVGLCMIQNSSKSSANPEFKRALEQQSSEPRPSVAPQATAPVSNTTAPVLTISTNTAPAPTLNLTNTPAK
jgi:protein translocase SecG subunit